MTAANRVPYNLATILALTRKEQDTKKGSVLSVVLALIVCASVPIFAGAGSEKPGPAAAGAARKANEAPMLAELVKAGKLPPVEQRLPPAPVVVKPANSVGKHGGTLHGTGLAPETTHDAQIGMAAGLFQFSDDLRTVTPELAESYEFSNGNGRVVLASARARALVLL